MLMPFGEEILLAARMVKMGRLFRERKARRKRD
jgi:hypothetical protein